MEFIKCSRCGSFYVNGGYVCAKCTPKDNFELATLKNFLDENVVDINEIYQISSKTGITEKNITRFLTYKEFENYTKM